MFTSCDSLIVAAAISSIARLDPNPSVPFELTLNMDAVKVPQNSWWGKITITVRCFLRDESLYFSSKFDHSSNSFELLITDENNITTTFNQFNKKQLSPFLHKIIAMHHFHQWCKKPMAGLLASNLANNKDFNRRFMRGQLGSAKLWFFVMRARVCGLPTKANNFSRNNLCRNCHEIPKWNSHALCGCPLLMGYVIDRHNKVLDIFENFLRSVLTPNSHWELLREATPPYFSCDLRPDIQLFNAHFKSYLIVDVKCPYDTDMSMFEQDQKISKNMKPLYRPLTHHYLDGKCAATLL